MTLNITKVNIKGLTTTEIENHLDIKLLNDIDESLKKTNKNLFER